MERDTVMAQMNTWNKKSCMLADGKLRTKSLLRRQWLLSLLVGKTLRDALLNGFVDLWIPLPLFPICKCDFFYRVPARHICSLGTCDPILRSADL